MTTAPPVTFSFATWIAMFPEFGALSSDMGQGYFNRACLTFANSITNPAFGDGNLAALLYLVTSHVAWLSCPRDGDGNPAASGTAPNQLVGRIASAGEGSVNVATEYKGSGSPNEEYFAQTRYGLEFWANTAQYRTSRYLARPTRIGLFPGLFPGSFSTPFRR